MEVGERTPEQSKIYPFCLAFIRIDETASALGVLKLTMYLKSTLSYFPFYCSSRLLYRRKQSPVSMFLLGGWLDKWIRCGRCQSREGLCAFTRESLCASAFVFEGLPLKEALLGTIRMFEPPITTRHKPPRCFRVPNP